MGTEKGAIIFKNIYKDSWSTGTLTQTTQSGAIQSAIMKKKTISILFAINKQVLHTPL